MNKHLKLTVNSSGLTIHWLSQISSSFSKMSKPNVESTQPELSPGGQCQYIKLSIQLHLVPGVKM
jgi:hypothetical protein